MAQDVNHVVLIGRLTRDLGADERSFGYTANGMARANISIAVNRSRKNGDQWIDEVSYFDVTIWGKTAENLKNHLVKGKQICVDGYLKQDRWQKDGVNHSRISIIANTVQLLGGSGGNTNNAIPGGYTQPESAAPSDNNFNSADEFPEDIPFC